MSTNIDSGYFLNLALGMLLQKIVVPSDFHNQAEVVRQMLRDDMSGLVDVLTDFAVSTATVDFNIETENPTFNALLNSWLDSINSEYLGQIPTGIKPLAKEYFKERWKGASFPILKITKWGKEGDIIVPTKMFFVDGGSVYAEDKDEKDDNLKLLNYEYYLGKEKQEKLSENVIITKPSGRLFDKYPNPFLIRRGIYHNWRIIESLKNKQTQILDQVIPYMLLVQKGTEGLARDSIKIYNDDELKAIKDQFQDLMDKMSDDYEVNKQKKIPIRTTQFDEEIKHLIPDLSTIFNSNLFAVAEKNILSGLGFIDVVEATSSSRKESILNPKAFIEEVNTGVADFKQILKDLVIMIKNKNTNHPKYLTNNKIHITSSPVKGFMTDRFKQTIRQLWSNGRLSDQTAVELVAEVDFQTEVYRKKQEAKDGLDSVFYPPLTQNREGVGTDIKDVPVDEGVPTGDQPKDEDSQGDPIPDEKTDPTEKQDFDTSANNDILEGAPYKQISELPKGVKNHMTADLQRVFMRVFNNTYSKYGETRAFRTAWSVIKQVARKDKKGTWIRKRKREDGSLKPITLTASMLTKAMEEVESEIIEEATKNIKSENSLLQNELLKNLLNKNKQEDK